MASVSRSQSRKDPLRNPEGLPPAYVPRVLKAYQSGLERRLIFFRANAYLELAEWTQAAIYAVDRFETEGWPDESGMGALVWSLGFPDLSLEVSLELLDAIKSMRPRGTGNEEANPSRSPLDSFKLMLELRASDFKAAGNWQAYGTAACASIAIETLEQGEMPRPYTLGPAIFFTAFAPDEIAASVFGLWESLLMALHKEDSTGGATQQADLRNDPSMDVVDKVSERVGHRRPLGFNTSGDR